MGYENTLTSLHWPFNDCRRIFKEIQTIEENEFNFKDEVCMCVETMCMCIVW